VKAESEQVHHMMHKLPSPNVIFLLFSSNKI